MRTSAELEALWQALPAAPRDRGTVRRIVLRKGGGVHECPERGTLEVERGLVGDRWFDGADPNPDTQVTLMNVHAAELVAHDTQPVHAPGDNLLVELDLSEAALPAGARLQVGTALLEVTAEPHLGCGLFRDRFGADALKWVNTPAHRPRRLRGVNCRVVLDGDVSVGDAITVEPPAS